MTSIITPNPDTPVDMNGNQLNRWWSNWFNVVYQICLSETQSGISANRPKSTDQNLIMWEGRPFFDTTLGKPIWFLSADPDVWVDATGAHV